MSNNAQPLFELSITPERIAEVEESRGITTAARFKQSRPFLYDKICARFKEGHSLRRIVKDCRDFGLPIHEDTAKAIRDAEFTPQQIRDFRGRAYQEAARVAVDVASDSLTAAAEEVEGMEPGATKTKLRIQLASTASVSAGIFNQNAELLSGNATHRVEEVTPGDPHLAYQAALAQAREAAGKIANAQNVTPLSEVFTPATPALSHAKTETPHHEE